MESVTVIIEGTPILFSGDELTSPAQQAILFLRGLDKDALNE